MLAGLSLLALLAAAAPADRAPREHPGREREPAPTLLAVAASAASAPVATFTNTSHIEALATSEGTLWAATRGGIEEYDLATLARRRLYTTADGLAENAVRALDSAGGLHARTARSLCTLAGGRFACRAAEPLPLPAPGPERTFHGARVTAKLAVAGRTFVGTAGRGLWLAGAQRRLLTPTDQICSNHIVAMARFAGRLWLASFDEGLCSFDGRRFRRARLPARMLNDLVATRDALFVATTRGLFRTSDGQRFRRAADLQARGVVDLALDGDTLWIASPDTLWELPLRPGARPRPHGRPGGSRALQAVDVRGGVVWLASEDRGAIRFAGQGAACGDARLGRPRRTAGGCGSPPRVADGFVVFDRAAGLPTSWAIDVAATPDGGAYLATLRDGVIRIDPDGTHRRLATPAPDAWLLHAGFAEGALWLGTQSGASRVVGETAQALTPLANPCVHAVFPEELGIWVATEGGTNLLARL